MKVIALLSTLFLTASTVWASGQVLARKVPALYPRTSFQGGWPIEADDCPSNTTSCQNLGSCCPTNTFCYTDGLGGVAACCPTTGDCSETATAIPACADPSWTLYVGNYLFFCCASGQIGILPDKSTTTGAGLCVEAGSNVAQTQLASVYGGAAPTAASTASVAASTPATSTGTPAGTTMAGTTASVTTASGTTASGTTVSPGTSSTPSTGTGSNPGTAKGNNAAKSSVSIIGITVGFLLIAFGT